MFWHYSNIPHNDTVNACVKSMHIAMHTVCTCIKHNCNTIQVFTRAKGEGKYLGLCSEASLQQCIVKEIMFVTGICVRTCNYSDGL